MEKKLRKSEVDQHVAVVRGINEISKGLRAIARSLELGIESWRDPLPRNPEETEDNIDDSQLRELDRLSDNLIERVRRYLALERLEEAKKLLEGDSS
jgi:hypothetical protein